jgi:ribonuclease BN (tRNA processing enzyme)
MEVQVLGAYGGESPECRLTCLLINGSTALDAGSLSQALPIERQAGVRTILLSHSHMDHTSALPFFIENVFGKTEGAIDLYASAATIYAIRKHLFNNDTWPDFTRLPNHLVPAIRFQEFDDDVPFVVEGVTYTPIRVNHVVPTHGFLIEQGGAALLWSSDTGPTERLWEVANATANLRAVALETSFDNAYQDLADISLHLTPQTMANELKKLRKRVPVLLHHLKPAFIEKIQQEIAELANPDLSFLEQGKTYRF